MARRRGDLAAAVEQAAIIDLPVTGRSDREIALAGDLRAAAMMNLGTVEAWSLRLPDAERHLQEGAALARQIGRPYLQLGCLAELSYASKGRSFATAVRRCREAIALAERHGWSTEPVVAPALVTLADRLIWMAELDEAEIWLRRRVARPPLGRRARHQAAVTPDDRDAAGRPRQQSRGARGVRRSRLPAIATGGSTNACDAGDRLDACCAGSRREDR